MLMIHTCTITMTDSLPNFS